MTARRPSTTPNIPKPPTPPTPPTNNGTPKLRRHRPLPLPQRVDKKHRVVRRGTDSLLTADVWGVVVCTRTRTTLEHAPARNGHKEEEEIITVLPHQHNSGPLRTDGPKLRSTPIYRPSCAAGERTYGIDTHIEQQVGRTNRHFQRGHLPHHSFPNLPTISTDQNEDHKQPSQQINSQLPKQSNSIRRPNTTLKSKPHTPHHTTLTFILPLL